MGGKGLTGAQRRSALLSPASASRRAVWYSPHPFQVRAAVHGEDAVAAQLFARLRIACFSLALVAICKTAPLDHIQAVCQSVGAPTGALLRAHEPQNDHRCDSFVEAI